MDRVLFKGGALEYRPHFNIAFESGKLTYSDLDVDTYNCGVNQILSVAATRGHNLYHFRMQDIVSIEGIPYAQMSVLYLPHDFDGDPLEAHRQVKKIEESLMPLSEMDLMFLRADDVKPNTPNLDLIEQTEKSSIILESIEATLNTTDKYELVRRCPDIPTPVTYKADSLEEAVEAIGKLPNNEGKFVLKDRFGYGCGAQVHLIDYKNPNLREILNSYIEQYKNVIVQEFCPEVKWGDIPLTFFDRKFIAARRRIAREGEWRTNTSLGATQHTYTPTRNQFEIAKQVAESFPECRHCAIDLLPSGKVLEINAFSGAAGIRDLYGISVGTIIMDKLEEEARLRRDEKLTPLHLITR